MLQLNTRILQGSRLLLQTRCTINTAKILHTVDVIKHAFSASSTNVNININSTNQLESMLAAIGKRCININSNSNGTVGGRRASALQVPLRRVSWGFESHAKRTYYFFAMNFETIIIQEIAIHGAENAQRQ